MSTRDWKPGDRVRVATDDFLPHIRRGDTGTVLRGPGFVADEGRSYVVALDKDPAGGIGHRFLADDKEPDL